jgi:hypothetical protein
MTFSVTIEGHGDAAGLYELGAYLARPWPDILTEDGPTHGGVASYGSQSVYLLDHQAVLSAIFAYDGAPVTALAEDVSINELAIDVADAAGLPAPPFALWTDREAMRISAVAGTTLTVSDRAWLGTRARAHRLGTPVYVGADPHFVQRRLWVSLNGTALGAWLLDGVEWDESTGLGVWCLKGTSALAELNNPVPARPRSVDIIGWVPGDGDTADLLVVRDEDGAALVDEWTQIFQGTHNPAVDGYAMLSPSGEVVAYTTSSTRTGLYLTYRGLNGTSPDTDLATVKSATQVMLVGEADPSNPEHVLPGSFYTLADGDDLLDIDPLTETAHPVDLMLILLTSPDDDTGVPRFAPNHQPGQRNYSTLPPGYGLGYAASDIHWASWLDVRARTPQWTWPRWRLGAAGEGAQRSAAQVLTQDFCEPLGLFITREPDGLHLSMPRIPAVGDVAECTVDPDTWRRVTPRVGSEHQVSGVVHKFGRAGEHPVDTRIAGESTGKPLTMDLNGPEPGQADLLGGRGKVTLLQQGRPRTVLEVDLADATADAPWGATASVTHGGLPNPRTGTRGWVGVPGRVLRRERQLDDNDGQTSTVEVLSYGPGYVVPRWAPSAYISSVAGTVVTTPAGGATGWQVDDVVEVLYAHGAPVGAGTTTVTAVNPGANTVTLASDLGGAVQAGRVLATAPYASATTRQRDRFAYLGNRARQTAGTGAPGVGFLGDD